MICTHLVVVLLFVAFLFLTIVTCRQFHVKIIPFQYVSNETNAFYTCVVDRFIECVHECTGGQGCKSVSFNKTSKVCSFHLSLHDAKKIPGSDLLLADVVPISDTLRNANLWLFSGNMTYGKATRQCRNSKARLFKIDNDEKQAKAVKMAEASGLEDIAIGLQKERFEWVYSDQNKVTYTAWAPGNPFPIGVYGTLSKMHSYRWTSIMSRVNGGICEKGYA